MEENVIPTESTNGGGEEPSSEAQNHPLWEKVNGIILEIRPYIQMDGGDIELAKIEDNIVYVYLKGACVGCPSSMMTLKGGVEARIRECIPEVESVEMM